MSEELLKPVQIAEILQLSTAAVYKLLRRGEIPTVRMLSTVRVKRVDLDRYIYEKTRLGVKAADGEAKPPLAEGHNASGPSQ